MVKLYNINKFLILLLFTSIFIICCNSENGKNTKNNDLDIQKKDSIKLPILPKIVEKEASKEEMKEYQSAHDSWYNDNPADAINKLKKFIKKYPKSSLSDDAQRLIGTCYSNLDQYDKSIKEYKKVEQNFPKSNSVPGSIYDRAHLYYYSLNNYDQAKKHYEKFINTATIDELKFRDIAVEQLNGWDNKVSQTKEAVKNWWRVEADSPTDYLEIVNHSWQKGGFGAVGLHNLSIKNKASVTYKDVIIEVTYFSETDVILSTSKKIIYKYFPPKKTINIYELNTGYVPADVHGTTVNIVSASFAKK